MIVTCKSRCSKGGRILDVRKPVNMRLADRLGMVAWWNSYGSGGNIVRCQVSQEHNGTLLNTAYHAGRAGCPGAYGTYRFSTDGYAEMLESVPMSGSFTMIGWAMRTILGDYGLFGKNLMDGFAYCEWEADQTIRFLLKNFDATTIFDLYSPATYGANRWVHIAAVYDENAGGFLYLDGKLEASTSSTGAYDLDGGHFEIGRLVNNNARFLAGRLASIRVCNKPLSANVVRWMRNDDIRGNPQMLNWVDDGGHISAGGRLLQLRRACA